MTTQPKPPLAVKTWASLPANAETDAALRVAAAVVCGFWFDENNYYMGSFELPDGWHRKTGRFGNGSYILCRRTVWLSKWNRDDLAMVFAAAWDLMRAEAHDFDKVERHSLEPRWLLALTDPRAALCALLDLLSVPVPQELQHE